MENVSFFNPHLHKSIFGDSKHILKIKIILEIQNYFSKNGGFAFQKNENFYFSDPQISKNNIF